MTRVLIVGAGPAGIRAAEALVSAGLHPTVADEGTHAGGQIYRRPPAGFLRTGAQLYGNEADKAAALHTVFDRLVAEGRVTHLPRRSVVALGEGRAYLVGATAECVAYDRLILATGATDRLTPVPGWECAGVYTLGAAQIALKAQGVALGRRIVLAGSGPLLTLVASQLADAGAEVAAVLDTAPMWAQLRGGAAMARARPLVTLRGLTMRARLGRRYRAGVRLERIETDGTAPTAVLWRDARGRSRRTDCDAVALGWHLRAETHLADLAGAAFDWSETAAQWLPRTDAMGRAGARLYLAGDGQRLLGADGAECAGHLAALACLEDLGLAHADPRPHLRRRARLERFAHGIARAFPWPASSVHALPADTVLCRCEGIRVDDFTASLGLAGDEINRAKSISRVGMGRCQGRYCHSAAAELIATALSVAPAAAGRLRTQPPIWPAPIGTWLAQLDSRDTVGHREGPAVWHAAPRP